MRGKFTKRGSRFTLSCLYRMSSDTCHGTRKWPRAFYFLTEASGTHHSPFVSTLSELRSLLIAFVFLMMSRRA
jgi:hypothetical protein